MDHISLEKDMSGEKTNVLPVIYTRSEDMNTPICESATFYQIETLWRKRFGLLHNIQERAVKYIYDIDNWEYIDGNDKEDAVWYYKGDPAYTISTQWDYKDNKDGIKRIRCINSTFYYLCTFLNIAYHPGIKFKSVFLRYNNLRLFENLVVMVDEGRTEVVDSSYGYYIKSTLQHGMYEFVFAYMCDSHSEEAKKQIERVIPIYESEDEKEKYERYAASRGWSKLDSITGSYNENFNELLDEYYVETPVVIWGNGKGRNIEYLLEAQKNGALFNFYNEAEFSKSEQEEISRRIKEGFVLVEILKEWRNNQNDKT